MTYGVASARYAIVIDDVHVGITSAPHVRYYLAHATDHENEHTTALIAVIGERKVPIRYFDHARRAERMLVALVRDAERARTSAADD